MTELPVYYNCKCYVSRKVIFNQVVIGFETRVPPPKSGTLATQLLDQIGHWVKGPLHQGLWSWRSQVQQEGVHQFFQHRGCKDSEMLWFQCFRQLFLLRLQFFRHFCTLLKTYGIRCKVAVLNFNFMNFFKILAFKGPKSHFCLSRLFFSRFSAIFQKRPFLGI